MNRKLILAFAFVFTLSFFGSVFLPPNNANATNASGFDPGRIIDDAIFYDPGSMGGPSNIQNFLNAHVPACDTWGTQPSGYGNLNNAQYAQQIKGWPGPPYVCLNNYYENPSTGETSFEKGGGAFSGGVSAAQIIYDAAQTYHINPKVLLVMLRKESLNLFSDSWPMKSQYKYAMGYACPDSGPGYSANCQSDKAGFYKQMTYAAWQLRYYYDHMGSYNYAPGQWNTIQYSPDPNCGTKDVYIQNYATASLYIYTPYTPNDAALNSYPGTAPCGAYGNRNFYFFWQEWFGSTMTNGNFVRSPDDATVYLVGDKVKYPIADTSLIGAAPALGGIGFVSQSYLDNIPTGSLLSRFIHGTDGTIYFYDSNIKLPFDSCAMVSAYGGNCGSVAELTQSQVDKLSTGPLMTKGMKTKGGRTYYIDGGVKKEVFDDQSLSAAGLSVGYNLLSDAAFNYLPYGKPIVRKDVITQSRQDQTRKLFTDDTTAYPLAVSQAVDDTFSQFTMGQLDNQSIDLLTIAPKTVNSSVVDETGKTYVITRDGKKLVPDPSSLGISPVVLPSTTIAKLNGTGSLSTVSLLKSYDNATVYVIVGGQKRPLVAMEDLQSITGESQSYIGWVTNDLINSIPTGNIIVGAGRLVKTPSNATVYMTDGYNNLIPMSTFDPAKDLGINMDIRTISDSILAKYTVDSSVLGSYVTCGSTNYIGMSGTLYKMTLSGGTVPRVLQAQTCNVLTKNEAAPGFVRTPDGTINQLTSGVLHPIGSWAKYVELSANGGITTGVTRSTASLLPTGSAIY
ncbi:MAG: hemagglutinin-like protein [Candidatus Saccharibacteria bacterium]|nr:hemagglutinin-like protein [Candidatus Saccharibacteria bacterium]